MSLYPQNSDTWNFTHWPVQTFTKIITNRISKFSARLKPTKRTNRPRGGTQQHTASTSIKTKSTQSHQSSLNHRLGFKRLWECDWLHYLCSSHGSTQETWWKRAQILGDRIFRNSIARKEREREKKKSEIQKTRWQYTTIILCLLRKKKTLFMIFKLKTQGSR